MASNLKIRVLVKNKIKKHFIKILRVYTINLSWFSLCINIEFESKLKPPLNLKKPLDSLDKNFFRKTINFRSDNYSITCAKKTFNCRNNLLEFLCGINTRMISKNVENNIW